MPIKEGDTTKEGTLMPDGSIKPPVSPSASLTSVADRSPVAVLTSSPAKDATKSAQSDLNGELERIKTTLGQLGESLKQKKEPEAPQKDTSKYFYEYDTYGNVTKSNDPNYSKQNSQQTETPQPKTVIDSYLEQRAEEARKAAEEFQAKADTLAASMKAANAAVVQGIKDSYDRMLREQEKINASMLGGITQAGIRSGRNRYASEIEMGNIQAEMNAGLQRVEDLVAKKNSLVAQAESANSEKEYELLFKTMQEVRQARKDETDALMELQKQAMEFEKQVLEKAKAAREQAKADFELQVNTAKSLAAVALSSLTGDEATDSQTISDLAKQYGIDPNILVGEIQALDREYATKFAPGIIGEYQYAVQNGYKGSFSDYQNEDANRKARVTNPITDAINQLRLEALQRQATEGKPPTAAQQTVATYATRIEQAMPTLKSLEESIKNMNYLRFEGELRMPAAAQSKEVQQYLQSARNFINAVLRRESGAVIADSEFNEAKQQYLPQPGDTPENLAAKEKNRQIVFESFKKAAGNAYSSVDELLGNGSKTVTIGDQEVAVGAIIENEAGEQARVEADGTLTPI